MTTTSTRRSTNQASSRRTSAVVVPNRSVSSSQLPRRSGLGVRARQQEPLAQIHSRGPQMDDLVLHALLTGQSPLPPAPHASDR